MTGSWKLVPVEATFDMQREGRIRQDLPDGIKASAVTTWAGNKWPNMLKAAPSPPNEVLERMARAASLVLQRRYGSSLAWEDICEADRGDLIEAMRAALTAAEGER